MSGKRLVVTGALGFIGGAVVTSALDRGWDVTGLDRASGEWGGADLVEVDLANPVALAEVLDDARPDAVVHCAGLGARAAGAPDAAALYEANARLTWRLLGALPPSIPVVAVSSAAVYGASASGLVSEEAPLSGDSHYAASKISAEAVCRAFAAQGRRVAIARPFNVHGPGEPAGSFTANVVSQITAAARSADPEAAATVRLLETNSVRDFIDVDDVALALVLLAGEQGAHGAFNVCTGHGTSLLEYVELAARVAGLEIAIECSHADLPGTVSVGDPSRLLALGWQARHTLEETVTRQLSAARLADDGRS